MNLLIVDEYFADSYAATLASEFPALTIERARTFSEAGDALGKAQGIFAHAHLFDDQIIGRAPHLQWIQALTSGTDVLARLRKLDPEVIVTSARGIHGPQMSEMTFVHMLALTHDVPRMLRNQAKGVWERWPQPLLYGKTAVLIGVGKVAESLARRCKAFEMTVIGVTRTPRSVEGFDRMVSREHMLDAAREADYFIVLVPHSHENDRIIGRDVLAALRPHAFLISMSRGRVLDDDALVEALRERRIAGAGLDAFLEEPLPSGHPLWSLDNVIVSPKHGGTTEIYVQQVLPILRTNIRSFLEHRRENMVNVVDLMHP